MHLKIELQDQNTTPQTMHIFRTHTLSQRHRQSRVEQFRERRNHRISKTQTSNGANLQSSFTQQRDDTNGKYFKKNVLNVTMETSISNSIEHFMQSSGTLDTLKGTAHDVMPSYGSKKETIRSIGSSQNF